MTISLWPLATTLLLAPAPAEPATAADEPAARDAPTRAFNRDRRRIQLAGMLSLSGWAVANLAGGTVGFFTADEGADKYFHQMNALWNLVNLPLGIIGMVSAAREDPGALGSRAAIRASRKQQRVYLINAALDLVYLTGGGLTWTLGAQRELPRAIGYGRSVVLQGAFLLAFDAVLLAVHERRLARYESRPRVAPGVALTGDALTLQLRGAF